MADIDLIKQIDSALSRGLRVALCTLIEKRGSGPREPGAKMVIFEDGRAFGTIGGGGFERVLIREALDAIRVGRSRKVVFSLSEEAGNGVIKTGLICGGEVEVFIDVMEPNPRLIIIGSGHVAEMLAKIAALLNFDIIIICDDEKLANRDRFPMAKDIITGDFKEALRRIDVTGRDFVVIVHGEPEHDYLALVEMIRKRPFYIGLMGSKIKIGRLIERLKGMGVSDEELESLHAPVGLNIGAKTPGEIAISIIAEIIAEKRKAEK